jgi:inhibitor of KinA sporulation pathway (predicted exonuclease)
MSAAQFLLVVDLEATCDDRDPRQRSRGDVGAVPKHEMETIEIGAVLVARASLEIVEAFDTFVAPVRHPRLTPFCTRLTSIRQADVDAAPRFPEAMKRLRAFLAGRAVTFCSWGDYDKHQLAQDGMHHRVGVDLGPHVNLRVAFTKRRGLAKRPDVGEALARVGLSFEGTPHRGIDDARNIARLLPWILVDDTFPSV